MFEIKCLRCALVLLRSVCDKHEEGLHSELKQECDRWERLSLMTPSFIRFALLTRPCTMRPLAASSCPLSNPFYSIILQYHGLWFSRYFYLPARAEHRGVGGLFFDDMPSSSQSSSVSSSGEPSTSASSTGSSHAQPFDAEAFTRSVGEGIWASWAPIAEKHRHQPFSDQEREWQLLRRGRYLEVSDM